MGTTVSKQMEKAKHAIISYGLFILIFFFVASTWRTFLGLIAFNNIYSEGDRVGQVIKMSKKGLFWKSWETTMGLTQSGAYIEKWDFSIDNQEPNKAALIKQMQEAYKTGQLVRVHYQQRYGILPWRVKTSYIAKEINFLTKPSENR